MIKSAILNDWEAIKSIYIEGINTGNATFQTSCEIADSENWFSSKVEGSTFIYKEDDKVIGWAALSPVSDRCVYSGVAEVSVYVTSEASGKGIGTKLLNQLIEFADKNNIWTLQAGIFPENIGSIKIHEKCDFRLVGKREKIGKMNGIWRDTLLFERRSKVII